ncbi:MAG: fucose isomerase [Thermoprotei archaeon]
MRVPVAFFGGFGGGFLEKDEALKALKEAYPEVEFKPYEVRTVQDAKSLLAEESKAAGILAFNARAMSEGPINTILRSGKPILFISQTMEGSPNYLMDVVQARKDGYPVLGIAAQDPLAKEVLEKVRYLVALQKIKESKVLLVTVSELTAYMTWAFPNSTEVSRAVSNFQQKLEVPIEFMDLRKFISDYYDRVDGSEAESWAKKWIDGASQMLEPSRDDVVKAAKLYLAMLRAARERNANVMAFDCIMNFTSKLIDAWPCLGYMQLWYDGIIPVCEADVYSFLPLLIGHYLFGRNGFVNDPGVDEVKGKFVYWHCYAPTNPHNSPKPEVPYIITDAHGGSKHASVHVKLPVNETVTVLAYNPLTSELSLHQARATENIFWKQLCATKLVAEGNARKVASNWSAGSGYHRVLLYGDLREEIRDFSVLLGVKLLEEDRGELRVTKTPKPSLLPSRAL